MKRILLLALIGGSTAMFAQTTLITENFDSYTDGATIAAESSGLWETWSGGVGTPEDAFISTTQAVSGANSMWVYNTAPGAYLHDVVLPLPMLYTAGTYEVKMQYYVPTGNGAYFNLGGNWVSGGAGYEYGVDVFFNTDGSGVVNAPSTGVFTYTPDTWFEVSCMVDLAANNVEVFIGGSSVFTGAWLAPGGFGVMDIFGVGYTDETLATEAVGNFYVDDVEFNEWVAFDVGVEEDVKQLNLSVVPNPNNGQFNIMFKDIEAGNYDLTITDMIGNKVHAEAMNVNPSTSVNFDLDLAKGFYIVNVTDGINSATKRFAVR
ncbi:T9SS type A sorting domain-containing protein [Crocinitomix catalasitica]|nr:T9SS type A sorting domain-containing protein [Crocinitomix catalasitica]